MNRTRTSRVAHSEAFLRSRARHGGAVAGDPPLSYQSAQSAFMALFDQFEDIDDLIRDGVPLVPPDDDAAPKRVQGARGPERRARTCRQRELLARRQRESGEGHRRR